MRVILGSPANGTPKPWHHYHVDGIMINAFELYTRNLHRKYSTAHEIVQADATYEIWIDSGGYQFLRRGMTPKIDMIAQVYREMEDATYFLNLDYPPSPTDTREEALRKMEISFRNFQYLREKVGDNVVPVLHYYHDEELVLNFLKRYIDYSCGIVAIGALVPYVLIVRGARGNTREKAMRFLLKLREIARDHKFRIHVLGLGSPVVIPILDLVGADSTDSSTWRVKAAYGKVVLPGGGEVHVTDRRINFGKRKATQRDLEYLKRFLEKTGFPLVHRFESIHTSFEYRALVNAYVIMRSREPPKSRTFEKIYNTLIKLVKENTY
ncbi:MAG: hypothetical protein GXO23_02705 [Crenarchaeota archaeon]|nr:hypothetical protein [Thermoproteota archaeon]